jgi:DNA-binding transcriptional LysR family regulator
MIERSVTRAAERLGRTQSAVSHSLSRLREQFGDPLLVKAGTEVPFPIAPLPHAMVWCGGRSRDPALRWLRDRLRPIVRRNFENQGMIRFGL